MFEMGESLNIVNKISISMLENETNANIIYQQIKNKKLLSKHNSYNYMEDLIEHFLH
jgi:hypothetical protein